PIDRRDDHEVAVGPVGSAVAGAAGHVHRADLRADALERAGDAVERALEVLRAQVRRVGIPDRLDHASDRALDERLALDRLERVALRDRVVHAPERLPGLRLGDGAAGAPALVSP